MKIGIAGCAGRMGITLCRLLLAHPDYTWVAGSEHAEGVANAEQTLRTHGINTENVVFTQDPAAMFEMCEVVIDFTRPEVSLHHAKIAAGSKTILVIGTTGFSLEQQQMLAVYAKHVPIIWSYNMSVGVNILSALVEKTAAILGTQFDIEILEMHHRHKIDAPSGTALLLGESAAKGRKSVLDKVAVKSRDGQIGPRKPGTIGFATLRGGDVVGEHSVIFAGEGERIELTHKASSRDIFAQGALRAALWAKGKPAGLYTMKDVLEI